MIIMLIFFFIIIVIIGMAQSIVSFDGFFGCPVAF